MKNNIKKCVIILTVLVTFLFLTSCLNYKSYYEASEGGEEIDLLSEIAEIEKELGLVEEGIAEELSEEDITIPFDEEIDLSKLQRIEVDENELVDLKVKIEDPDEDEVHYTFSLPLNEQGKWKTNYGDTGEYVVTITASDGELTARKDILLVIGRVNVPPLLKAIKDKIVKEGETVVLEPQVIDPNKDQITVTISEPLASGAWETDHTSAGEYEVVITASDGELESKEVFLLTVTDVNVPPDMTGLEDITIKEGETVEIKPVVTDLDDDEITLSISEPIGDDGVWETKYTNHGVYEITVTASDGKDTVTKKISLTVEDVNMPPEIIEVKLG
jgi:nitrogen fixation protein FixH